MVGQNKHFVHNPPSSSLLIVSETFHSRASRSVSTVGVLREPNDTAFGGDVYNLTNSRTS